MIKTRGFIFRERDGERPSHLPSNFCDPKTRRRHFTIAYLYSEEYGWIVVVFIGFIGQKCTLALGSDLKKQAWPNLSLDMSNKIITQAYDEWDLSVLHDCIVKKKRWLSSQ